MERAIPTAEVQPDAAAPDANGSGAPAEASQQGVGGLKYGSYVPTRKEIESGAVVVQEVVAVQRTEHIETEQLQWESTDDTEKAVEAVTKNLFTKDWNERFETMHFARKLIKFHPVALTELIADVGKCLLECLKNPRSAILREACMLCADLLGSNALMEAVCERVGFDKLVPVLLLKAINDKKFIREAAQHALHLHAHSAPHMYHEYLGCCDHRNHKVATAATSIVALCLDHLAAIPEDRVPELTKKLVKACLHGRLADTRKHGKRSLEILEQMLGRDVLQASLDAHCNQKDAGAVQRELHPEELEASPRSRNSTTSIAEMIAQNSPKSSAQNSPSAKAGQPVLEPDPVAVDAADVAGDKDAESSCRISSTPRSRRHSDEVLQEF